MTLIYRLRRSCFPLVVCAVAALAGACGGTVVTQWTEQVQFSDGTVGNIELSAVSSGGGLLSNEGNSAVSYTIRAPGVEAPWHTEQVASYAPVLVDFDGTAFYVGALIVACSVCEERGWPDPSLVVWKSNGKSWIQVGVDRLPPTTRLNLIGNPWNVLHSVSTRSDLSGYYSLQMKQEICRFEYTCKGRYGELLADYVREVPDRFKDSQTCKKLCLAQRPNAAITVPSSMEASSVTRSGQQ